MLTQTDVYHALNWSWAGLSFIAWIHTITIITWACEAIISGFSNGILHMAPIAVEIFIIKLVSESISGFSLGGAESLVATTKVQLIFFTITSLVIAIACNLAHGIYTLVVDVSTWYLIVLVILLGFVVFLECVMIYYLVKLRKHLFLFMELRNGKFH